MLGSKSSKKVGTIGRAILAFLLNAVLLFGVLFNLVACAPKTQDPDGSDEPQDPGGENVEVVDPIPTAFVNEYPATTQVGYYGRITNSNVQRVKALPGVHDEGTSSDGMYPVYGKNYSGDKEAVISESSYLTASPTWNGGGGGYTWMDEGGYLYKGTRANPVPVTGSMLDPNSSSQRRLYKHTAAAGNYHGDVDDNEPGVEKVVTFRPRGYTRGYNVTGIYAPAGEIITIKMSKKDMDATGGVQIHIGQALYNGKANNIWAAKGVNRMPVILNTMDVNKDTAEYDEVTQTYTAYVGSFLGGPLYIRNESVTFSTTISGGVEYPHLILGYTTEEEYNSLVKSTSAPYFDMEVWHYGVLISGPRTYSEPFSYGELYQAAVLWEKITTVTTIGNQQGIVMLFDPFVAAGAAVAFPGQGSVNCPEGWMPQALNYNLMVTSGAWGNFHEYHHNFQNFGVGGGGEVTNNALTLVSYALFTKISSARNMSNYGAGSMGGWNRYTSATWALNDVLKLENGGSPENGKQGLALYATLLHNFGPDNFIQTKAIRNTGNYQAYMNVWEEVTHNNMYYYFNDILQGGVTANDGSKSYPTFVPVASVYQTGRSYIDGETGEKKYIKTMRPYQIKDGAPFTVDLTQYTAPDNKYASGSIVVPKGVTYEVKNVTQPVRGSVEWTAGSKSFIYTPDSTGKGTSGEILVTLSLKKGNVTFDDVDLVLEFEPTKELNKSVLERTVYTYAEGAGYTEAADAFDHDFEGYVDKYTVDHTSPGQNVNTDIWFRNKGEQYPNDPDHFYVNDKQIHVIDGKLYFESDGKYRVYLRARWHAALYFSLDGTDYRLGGKIDSSQTMPGNGLQFRLNDPNTYFDVEFNRGKVTVYLNFDGGRTLTYNIGAENVNWLYIKEVLVAGWEPNGTRFDYIGVGMSKWTETMFTVEERYYDSSNQTVTSPDSTGYSYTEATYKDQNGTAIAIQKTNKDGSIEYYQISGGNRTEIDTEMFGELTKSRLIEPKSANYVNAYRRSYEFPDNSQFESDYFRQRQYTYSYSDNVQLGVGQQRVVTEQCKTPAIHTGYGTDDLSVLVDGITNQGGKLQVHTNDNSTTIGENNPFTIVIDLGNVYTANRLVLYSQNGRSDPRYPKALNLYSSLDGENYTLVKKFTDIPYNNNNPKQTIDFEDTQMRYYKVEFIQSTHAQNSLIIREIEMWRIFEVNNGSQITPDNADISYLGDWSIEHAMSTFGHVYVGQAGAKISYEFTGTRFAILSSSKFGKNFEVYIDGVQIESIALKTDNGDTALTYMTSELASGKHRVEIRCTGEANFDSFVVYP